MGLSCGIILVFLSIVRIIRKLLEIPIEYAVISISPNGDRNKIDYIIDPQKSNPESLKSESVRILILGDINDSENVGQDVGDTPNNFRYDGPDAWKNADGSDFVASANDIVEWSGTEWKVVFDASTHDTDDTIYTTNLNTGVQYKYYKGEWLLSFEGEYQNGTWRIAF